MNLLCKQNLSGLEQSTIDRYKDCVGDILQKSCWAIANILSVPDLANQYTSRNQISLFLEVVDVLTSSDSAARIQLRNEVKNEIVTEAFFALANLLTEADRRELAYVLTVEQSSLSDSNASN